MQHIRPSLPYRHPNTEINTNNLCAKEMCNCVWDFNIWNDKRIFKTGFLETDEIRIAVLLKMQFW